MLQKMNKRVILNNSQCSNNKPYGSGHYFRLPAFFVFVGLVLLVLSGCTLLNDGVSENENLSGYTTQREEDSAMMEDSNLAEISRPPIDLGLPGGLKTATLAMG
jgi:hypothetical protein